MSVTAKTRRTFRTRNKIKAVSSRPRLSVFRSDKHIYAQIIDDAAGATLAAASSVALPAKSGTKTEVAKAVGAAIAQAALSANIKAVVFDRGAYQYHGRVKALADAAREGGLDF
jgi:large subunit ribosomal protein L18